MSTNGKHSSSNIGDLINQMKPKRNPDEIDVNKKSSEEKFKTTVKEVEFDYYKILGVESTATAIELKRAYQSKLKKLHPDKIEQTKENKEKYKLLREAGDLLCDSHERKAYDMQRRMDATSKDFKLQKDSFKEFKKLQDQHSTDEDKAIAKLNFEQSLANMDRKHGYIKKDSEAITKEEHDRRMEDLKLQRDQQDIEMTHENIFEGRQFNPAEFNKLFDKKKRRDDKRKKTTGGLAKVSDMIAAFNDFDGGSGGIGIEHCDNLYSEGQFTDYNANYAGVEAGVIGADNGKSDDDISIDSPDEDEYDGHKKGVTKESLDIVMKRMMDDRTNQNDSFDKMNPTDYGSALDDKYGISNQFGFMVGTDKFGHQKNIKKRNIQEETLKAYKQLTEK